jgi:class 3 adenylate cyclase/tetratricopeptide (TPR) repeat protein
MTTAEGTVTCSVCRGVNPASARFCNVCGSRLAPAGERVEERKVVTALFCDLVGFTASSEGADPEDVDRMLSGYETTVRGLIESHGGVVEKFIGDAVVGVFGIPAAHEDDPERAVRAALRIATEAAKLPGVGDVPLRLRVGINTGEALVRLDVSPGTGDRFVAGDTINTASRIQSVAPEMGVAVGPATYEATRRRFDYVELPPATLKGKAEPVRVFQPTAPRSRLGTDVGPAPATRLVGRDAEFDAVRAAFHEAVDSTSMRFVMVVGAPGMGKSRLVAELLAYVNAQPILVLWRQGRCLPYGTGISFWALGEIVKAHAGILESDDASVAVEKLDQVLPEGDERSWFRERLLPLLGIEAGTAADRAEQFTAWRRFLELISEGRPTVLVFEDLHWADDAMLAFLEELVASDTAMPLLAVGTARPELLARRSGFPGAEAHAVRIDLSSLDDDAATAVATSVLESGRLAPSLLEPILDRAAGNPLFVEEFVRLLVDRELLADTDGVLDLREDATLPVPDSISALLAARLDALPLDWKALLGDASVLGKVFWDGALTAMGDRTLEAVASALDGLVERELIRPAATSTMAGDREYVFWHVLGRDVAYAALPRTARGTRHVAAAHWIEGRAGDRVEDVSDVLAHHYRTALDLARASGDDARANELQAPAFRFLSLAGERAMGLDAPAALALLEAALELAPAGATERPIALHRYGVILKDVGRLEESIAAQEEAIADFLANGDTRMAGQAMLDENDPLRFLGRPTRTEEVLALLEPLGPSLPLARALQRLASGLTLNGEHTMAIEVSDRIESMLEALPDAGPRDAARVRIPLLGVRGFALAKLGDAGGIDVMRRGADAALQAGYGVAAIAALGNLAFAHSEHHGPLGAIELVDEVQRIEATRGLHGLAEYALEGLVVFHYEAGRLEPALRFADDMEARIGDTNALELLIELRAFRMRIMTLRGLASEDAVIESLVQAVHELAWDEHVILGLSTAAAACLARGRRDDALAHLREVSQHHWTSAATFGQRFLADAVRTAVALGDLDLAESLGRDMPTAVPFSRWARRSQDAMLLEARGQLDEAAEEYASVVAGWRELGIIPELALSLLGQGRTLVADARPDEARPILAEARRLLEALGAAPSIAEIDRLGMGQVAT